MKKLPRFTGDHELVPLLNRLVEAIQERTPLRTDECPIDHIPETGFRVKPRPAPPVQGGSNRQVWL